MVQFTIVSRLSDGLPLVASTDAAPPGSAAEFEGLKQQARAIVKKLNTRSPSRMSLDAGAESFNYVVEEGIVYLVMCDKAYPKKLAFAYLADVHAAFVEELRRDFGDGWKAHVDTVGRAYTFLRFDRQLQRLKREFNDPSSRANSSRLASDLNDISSIMRRNVTEVLDRGEKLENVSKISTRLVSESKRFKWGAKKLNALDAWKRWAPLIIAAIIVAAVMFWYLR